MTRVPEARYARTPDGVYHPVQVVGEGPGPHRWRLHRVVEP